MADGQAQGDTGSSGMWEGATEGAGLIGGLTAFYQPFISQHWASDATRKARHWAQFMAKHQIQYAVKDMTKAGINPMLAAGAGIHGAQAPAAPVQRPDFDIDGDVVGRAVSSAKAVGIMRDQIAMVRAQRLKAELEVQGQAQQNAKLANETATEASRKLLVDAQAGQSGAQKGLIEGQTGMLGSQRELMGAQVRKIMSEIPELQARVKLLGADFEKRYAEMDNVQAETMLRMVHLQLERSKLPSAKAVEEFDNTPDGQLLRKWKRSAQGLPGIGWLWKD